MRAFLVGVNGFGKALAFLFRHRMGWYFLVPIALWLLLATSTFALGVHLGDVLLRWTDAHWGIEAPAMDRSGWAGLWDNVLAFLNGAREVLVVLAVKVALLFLTGLLGKYVVLVLQSPLLAWVSERAEEIVTGRRYPFNLARLLKDALRGGLIALRNGAVELTINLFAWLLTLLMPVMIPLTTVVLLAVSCWFYGFSMHDYRYERLGLGMRSSLARARAEGGLLMGNGLCFWFLMRIPVLGWIMGPLLGAVGAVLAAEELNSGRSLPRV